MTAVMQHMIDHNMSSNLHYVNVNDEEERERINKDYYLPEGDSSNNISSPSFSYSRSLQIEILVCVLFATATQLNHSSSITFFHGGISNNVQRPIPYMITTNSQDIIINLTYNHEYIGKDQVTIPDYLLVVVGIILPSFLIIATSVTIGALQSQIRNSSSSFLDRLKVILKYTIPDIHSAICLITVSYGSTRLFTDFLKNYVGYMRPNFYNMCQFNIETISCDATENLKSARRSFPSGHSSISFCGMTCLALYLAGKVGLHSHLQTSYQPQEENNNNNSSNVVRGEETPKIGKWGLKTLCKKIVFLFAIGGPLFLSTFVAASRVHDNWHHPADVVAGALIGATTASIAYHVWLVLLSFFQQRYTYSLNPKKAY
jgi:membrane-associated phospholipid phosphatase